VDSAHKTYDMSNKNEDVVFDLIEIEHINFGDPFTLTVACEVNTFGMNK
jgi:hypothetical protein